MLKLILDIFAGWRLCHKLIKRNGITGDCMIVIMSCSNKDIDYYSLKYLRNYLIKTESPASYIFTSNPQIQMNSTNANVYEIIYLTETQLEKLITYYCCCLPAGKYVVVDVNAMPVRKNIQCLLDEKKITWEQVVVHGIYQLSCIDII